MSSSAMDLKKCQEVSECIDKLTTSGEPHLNKDTMKKMKTICKQSDAYVTYTHGLLMTQLDRQHAEVRLSTFQICDELFNRSHIFRELILADFQEFMELTIEANPECPLPPPQSAAKTLKRNALDAIHRWNEKYGNDYKKLSLGYNYLRNCKKMDFTGTDVRTEAENRRIQEQEQRQGLMRRQRLENILKEMSDNSLSVKDVLIQIENCLRLLLPDPESFQIHGLMSPEHVSNSDNPFLSYAKRTPAGISAARREVRKTSDLSKIKGRRDSQKGDEPSNRSVSEKQESNKQSADSKLIGECMKVKQEPDDDENTLAHQSLLYDETRKKIITDGDSEKQSSADNNTKKEIITDSNLKKQSSTDSHNKKQSSTDSHTKKQSSADSQTKIQRFGDIEKESSNDGHTKKQSPTDSQTKKQSSTDSQTKKQSSTDSQTKKQSSTDSQTKKQSSTDSQTKKQSSTDSQTKKQSSTDSQTKKQSSTDSQTKKQSSTDSQTMKQSSTHSQTKKQSSTHSQTKKQSSTDSQTKKQSSTDSQTKKQSSTDSQTKKQSSTDSQTKKESSSDSHTKKQSSSDSQTKKQSSTDSHTKKQSSSDSHTKKQSSGDREKQNFNDSHRKRQSSSDSRTKKQNSANSETKKQYSADSHTKKQSSADSHGKKQSSADTEKKSSTDTHIKKESSTDSPVKKQTDNNAKTQSESAVKHDALVEPGTGSGVKHEELARPSGTAGPSDEEGEFEEIGTPSSSEDEATEEEDVVRSHGLLSQLYRMQVEVNPQDMRVQETEDNTDLLYTLRDLGQQVTRKLLPQVQRWLEVLAKTGAEQNQIQKAIDIKNALQLAKKRITSFRILPRENLSVKLNRKESVDGEEDDDDDDFEDVPTKDGYEDDIPEDLREPVIPKVPKAPTARDWSFPDVRLRKRKVDEELDPTTPQATLRKLMAKHRMNQKAGSKSVKQEEMAGTSSLTSSLTSSVTSECHSSVPVVPFGTDLFHWGEKREVPLVVKYEPNHRFWNPAFDEDDVVDKVALESMNKRTINFTGKFQPVKWSCRAPLNNGTLCPRRDRYKCPFHGKVIPRDNMGRPSNPEDSMRLAEEELKKRKDQLPEWEDPDLQAEIEAATGANLDPLRSKVKTRKGRKRKYPGLTDINKTQSTTKTRLEKKILSPKALRRVEEKISNMNHRKFSDKFGNNYNYALN